MKYPLLLLFFVFSCLLSTANDKTSANRTVYVDPAVKTLSLNESLPSSSTLQLFTHGKPGQLLINGQWKNQEAIAVWLKQQYKLSNFNHINIYGCEFAKGQVGSEAVHYLENELHVSVAASTNITGKDGDWILEAGNSKDGLSFPAYKGNLQCGGLLGGMGANDDFDGDGICNSVDIDDDNDGILDVTECNPTNLTTKSIKKALQFNNAGDVAEWEVTGGILAPKHSSVDNVTVNSKWTNAPIPSPTGDGFLTARDIGGGRGGVKFPSSGIQSQGGPASSYQGDISGATKFSFDLFDADPFVGTNIDYGYSITIYLNPGATINLTGSFTPAQLAILNGIQNAPDPGSGAWTTSPNWATISIDLPLTLPAGTQLRGMQIMIENITDAGSTEVMGLDNVTFYSETALVGCSDLDGDGIPNIFDLDSDGDGCPDAVEAGISGTFLNGVLINVSGLITYPGSIAQGAYGANGFANALEFPAESGTYTGSYSNYLANATNSSIHTCPVMPQTRPDVSSTFVGVQIAGNVSTNDIIPSGSLYTSLTVLPGFTNPGPALPTLNPDGSGNYTFTSAIPGLYKFLVTVCPPLVSVNCPKEVLTITVADANTTNNKPFAAPDFGVTKANTQIILNTLQNDKANNTSAALDPSVVSITSAPKHGTAVANPATGEITYVPATGFVGIDTLQYTICDNVTPVPNCASSYQIITVLPSSAANSLLASDDYNKILNTGIAAGNVSLNDIDPDAGNIKTVTPQNSTIPGVGVFTLASDGTYSFDPENNFTGPVEFPYTVCDNGTPQACRKATLHILVSALSTLPVKLTRFYGSHKTEGNIVHWQTAEEINASHFEISYSSTGQNFVTIYSTPAAGNSSVIKDYSFLHLQAQAGNNFYQLISVDLDGKREYSSVINIRINANNELTVYPVPAKNEVTIQGAKEELSTIRLYNTIGQDLTSLVRVVKLGETVSTISIANLAQGVYYIKTKTQSQKIIKQ